MILSRLALVAGLALLPLPALACSAEGDGTMTMSDGSAMGRGVPIDMSASTKAFMDANAAMHKNMGIVFSGNADVDFVRGMIPHHQGAIDMAKVVLEHGKDEAIKKLASGIIQAQEREIAEMQAWLELNAPAAAPATDKVPAPSPMDHSGH